MPGRSEGIVEKHRLPHRKGVGPADGGVFYRSADRCLGVVGGVFNLMPAKPGFFLRGGRSEYERALQPALPLMRPNSLAFQKPGGRDVRRQQHYILLVPKAQRRSGLPGLPPGASAH